MSTTQITTRQITDGAITDAKVAAGAAIATTKLADAANFVLRDGSVAMTGSLNMSSQKITNLQTPSSGSDAATMSYVDTAISTLNSMFDAKPSAKAATTGNITIANPGTSSFDGVTLSSGDLLFVRAQSTASQNGLYTFNGSGSALTRHATMDAWDELPGAMFAVEEGSTYANTIWLCTVVAGGTIGTTAITFTLANSSGLSSSNFVDKEVPSGSINGSNTAYTLAYTPVSGSEHVYLNGILQESGAGNDYTISGASITMLTAPLTGEKLRVTYRK